jgi:surface protein
MPISNWNMTKVISTINMFANTNVFNQPLSNWERAGSTMSNVTDMSSMFQSASAFNQNIGNWNVSNVTNFQQMFQASAFNNNGSSDINNWIINTGASVNMQSMFNSNGVFNQPLDSWNTSEVTNMSNMFGSKQYTQPLNLWNIGGDSSVTTINMGSMFIRNGSFNQDISMWNVSKVTNMSFMFYNDAAPVSTFNQNIGSWNVGNVTDMGSMFSNLFTNASSMDFNQNIGSWNISNVTNFGSFMAGKTSTNFSTANLDAIYNGWSSLPSIQPNISSPLATNISFGTAKYTAAGTPGKNILLAAPNNWIIQDGGI